jgi:hypothetical protein
MTNITIDKNVSLSKTHFADLEELQEEILLQIHSNFELSEDHKRILDEREKELDEATDKGLTWEEVRASIQRKNA